MSWFEIPPFHRLDKRSSLKHAPVEFIVGYDIGGVKDRSLIATIMIRIGLIADCPKFLRRGAFVRVFEGSGNQANMVRLVPGAGTLIAIAGGLTAKSKPVLLIRFPLPKIAEPQKCRSVAEFDYGDDWLEVTVPDCLCIRAGGATS